MLKEGELQRNSVIKNYLTTAADGKNYEVTFYSLEMIMAIGFRVRSKRGTQFRIWANQHLTEYLVKGFTMDDERLKNPNGRPDYFDELLERIREIRIYDKNVKVSELTGTNKDFIMAKIPHLQHFVTDDLEAVCRESDVLVVTNKEKEFAELLARWPGKTVVDLVRQWKEVDYDGRYEGLSWGDINSNRSGQSSDVKRDFRQTEF